MDTSFIPSACSRHTSELVQQYCEQCHELLCLKCIIKGDTHRNHSLIDYKRYLRQEQREAEELVNQLNQMIVSAGKFKTQLSEAVKNFKQSCVESERSLESFGIVKKEIDEWQEQLNSDLETDKATQLKILDTEIENAKRGQITNDCVTIDLPRVTVHKPIRNNLREKARELVPTCFSSFASLISHNKDSDLYSTIDEEDNTQDSEEYDGEIYEDLVIPESPPTSLPSPPISHTPMNKKPSLINHDTLPTPVVAGNSLPPPPLPPRDSLDYDHMPPAAVNQVYNLPPLPPKDTIDYDHIPPSLPPRPPRNRSASSQYNGDTEKSVEYVNLPSRSDSDKWSRSYQQLNSPPVLSQQSNSYAIPTTSSKRFPPPPSMAAEVIPPAHIIIPSCLAKAGSEEVSLHDLCITSEGMMVFSDRVNRCLRSLLGTDEDSEIKVTYFKDVKPHALAYDAPNHRVMMATDKGLYQVDCSTHLTKMNKKKIAKLDVVPLAMTCSSGAKKKGASLLYMTLWPLSGDNGIFRYSNGEYDSRIPATKPYGIDYMNEYLVVTNLNDGTVDKMSPRGGPLWDSSVDAKKPGILDQPTAVAILPGSEYIAVTEAGTHRVTIFSDKGKFFTRFGRKGTGRGEFNGPCGVAVRLSKELVVIDNERIQIFSFQSLGLSLHGEAMYEVLPLNY